MSKNCLLLLVQIFLLGGTSVVWAGEPGQQFEGFNLQGYTRDGKKSWTVNGDNADILGDKIKISNVAGESYGDEKVNLTAETGTIDQASGIIHLEKDVVITSERGTQMTTDSLDWNRNEDLVKTNDDVLITDKDMTMTGTGMEAHPAMKTAQIDQDVTVTMDTQPDPEVTSQITITSDGPMVIDQTKSYAVFQDNVVAVQADQTLKADRMEIFFDETKRQIKEMICSGHVVIIRGANQSFADKAVYNGRERKLTLSGRPKLILVTEGENAITALGN
ncbi:MAG: LPS export ABC transporter periplasmic protein LptC [Omnitrophica WOR_2 bacterium RIFCSPHIGHO2_01_FULL_52_10]|nr:MAG: LPS export ABC transporter periplasmic protein LptC [Omnitrophica WOR_2 bacterium RIFCSPHIGHO2_01_FULL_52_10]